MILLSHRFTMVTPSVQMPFSCVLQDFLPSKKVPRHSQEKTRVAPLRGVRNGGRVAFLWLISCFFWGKSIQLLPMAFGAQPQQQSQTWFWNAAAEGLRLSGDQSPQVHCTNMIKHMSFQGQKKVVSQCLRTVRLNPRTPRSLSVFMPEPLLYARTVGGGFHGGEEGVPKLCQMSAPVHAWTTQVPSSYVGMAKMASLRERHWDWFSQQKHHCLVIHYIIVSS